MLKTSRFMAKMVKKTLMIAPSRTMTRVPNARKKSTKAAPKEVITMKKTTSKTSKDR